MTEIPFVEGLHTVRGGCRAWLAPDGGWGLSNAGLVTSKKESLLVDTLFDLPHTARMLTAAEAVTSSAPISTVVNTHANGDHYFGNQLLADRDIIASNAAADAMTDAALLAFDARLSRTDIVGEFVRSLYKPFDFGGITITPPNRTFDGRMSVNVGDLTVELIEVGPAHTAGDVIAYVPESGVVYAGDVLFVDGTPIVWAGPYDGWRAACEYMLTLDADIYVPGHGPVTDAAGVRKMIDYLDLVEQQATASVHAGLDFDEAVARIDLGEFATWEGSSRVVQNIAIVYARLEPEFVLPSSLDIYERMAVLEGFTPVSEVSR